VVHGANIRTGEAGLPRRAWVVARGRRDAPPASVWRGRAPAATRPTPARPAPARPTPARPTPARPTPARPAPARPTPAGPTPTPPTPTRSGAEAKAAPEAAIEATVEPAEAASAKAAMKPAEAATAEAAVEPASATLCEGRGHARCETRHDKRCRNQAADNPGFWYAHGAPRKVGRPRDSTQRIPESSTAKRRQCHAACNPGLPGQPVDFASAWRTVVFARAFRQGCLCHGPSRPLLQRGRGPIS